MIPPTEWRGYWPAATTPFTRSGALDLGAWREQLELYLSLGVHGTLVNGSSGEWYTQTVEERRQVAEVAVATVAGAFPVVVGCTGFTADAVIEVARGASDAGVDGILFTPPPYAAPNEREVLAFYTEVHDATDVPIMVYNWPRGTALDLSTDLMAALLELPRVGSIKDSTPDYQQHLATLGRLGSDTVFFANYISRQGLGVLTELGGNGSIEGGALGSRHGVAFWDAYWAGDLPAAREHANAYDAQLADMIGYNFVGLHGSQIAQIKAAMRRLGQPGGYPRRPLLDIEDSAMPGLEAVLRRHGLL